MIDEHYPTIKGGDIELLEYDRGGIGVIIDIIREFRHDIISGEVARDWPTDIEATDQYSSKLKKTRISPWAEHTWLRDVLHGFRSFDQLTGELTVWTTPARVWEGRA